VLNAGLPGHTPRESALIGQMVRYHRKGTPTLGEFSVLAQPGDEARVTRGAAVLRLAEQLERARDQTVRAARAGLGSGGEVLLRLESPADTTVARWGAQKQADVFERAFGRPLAVSAA
jgi:exopolyphosphatase / guanosine-5'-triphosphate,3'-diphosphate pyrophosphatase